jgi:hypothetical protein
LVFYLRLGEEMLLVTRDETIDLGFQSCGEDRGVRWIGDVFYDVFNRILGGIIDNFDSGLPEQ